MGRRSRQEDYDPDKPYVAFPVPAGVEPLGDYLLREIKPPTYWEMADVPDDQAQPVLAKVVHRARVSMGRWLREAGEVYWDAYMRDPAPWQAATEHRWAVGTMVRPWWRAHGMRDLYRPSDPVRTPLTQRHTQDGVNHVQGLLLQVMASSPGGRMEISQALMELLWYAVPHPLHHPGQYLAMDAGPTGDAVWTVDKREIEDYIARRLAQMQATALRDGTPFDQAKADDFASYMRGRTHAYVSNPSVYELATNLGIVAPWMFTAVRNRETLASPEWLPTPMATWWARQCLGTLTTWMGSTQRPEQVHELFADLERVYAELYQDPVPWAVLHCRANRGSSDLSDAPALWRWSKLFEWLAGPDLTQNPWARELALRACLMAGPAGAPCPAGDYVPDETAWTDKVHVLLDGTGASLRPRQPSDPEECYDLVLCLDGVPVPGPARKPKDPAKTYEPYYKPHCALSVRRLRCDKPGETHGPMPRLSYMARLETRPLGGSCMAGPWYQHILRTWGIRRARGRYDVDGVYQPQIAPDIGYRVLRCAPTWGYQLS